MVARWWGKLDARPGARDLLVAAVWLVLGLLLTSAGAVRLWENLAIVQLPDGAFYATLVGICGVALLRSRRPLLALALGAVVTLADLSLGGSIAVILILTDLIYTAVKYGSDRGVRALLWCAVGGSVALGIGLLVRQPTDSALPVFLIQWLLILTIPALWGWSVRNERARTRTEMARQHARSARQLRSQIAHDLHDLVANQIAVAGLHVEASKLVAARDELDTRALFRSLEQAKRGTDQAHRELRHLIAVLGAVDDLDEPTTLILDERLRDLAQLLPSGRSFELPGEDVEMLQDVLRSAPLAHQQIILRALQELVVNAAKHGCGDVRIRVRSGAGSVLRVSVTNNFSASGGDAPGSGLGIRGTGLLLGGIGAQLESGVSGRPGTWCASITLAPSLARSPLPSPSPPSSPSPQATRSRR